MEAREISRESHKCFKNVNFAHYVWECNWGGDPINVVFKSEGIFSTWTENSPKGTQYNRFKSGWCDAMCFEDFFENLLLPTLKKNEGKKVIISYNLSSHICSQNVQKKHHSFCLTASQLDPLNTAT